jgi:hypothetical protein
MTPRERARLKDIHARLKQADRHLAHLRSLLTEWLQSDPFDIICGLEEDGWYRLRFQRIPEPPQELEVDLADMLGNLRAALDYLAWQLVLVSSDTPHGSTAFPVVRRERDWPHRARALAGMRNEYIDRIRAMQPFHDAQPNQHPLAFLDKTNNFSKHRFLAEAAVNRIQLAVAVGWEQPLPENATLEVIKPRNPEIRAGVVIFAVRPSPQDMKLTLEIPMMKAGIGFDTGIEQSGDFPDLPAAVRTVVDGFEDVFGH